MNTATTSPSPRQHPHPAPHRARLSGGATWFALLAAPLAWSVQQLINAGIAAHACYPHDEPVAVPLWQGLTAVALSINVVACIVCVVAGVLAWRNWRATRTEVAGTAHHLMGGGTGRTRFMAMAGLMTSGLFLVAVLFAAGGLLIVTGCFVA